MSYEYFFGEEPSRRESWGGIIFGIVRENWDEENKGKVKVEIFSGEEGKTETAWIRTMSLYTGNNAGWYCLPEIGTEVLVAFIGGSRNEPIVIGSLWNDTNVIDPVFAVENNIVKAFRTKAGHEVVMSEEEEKGEIRIQSVGKLQISLSDEKKVIKVTDEDAGSLVEVDFENGKITLDAGKELHLAVGNKDVITIDDKSITLKSDSITIESGQGLSLKGQSTEIAGNSLKLKSDASLEMKAGATLKMEGSAMTEVKGGMVKIN